MNKPTNMNPGDGKILPCVDDAACEITSCEVCMKEVPVSATLNEEGVDYIHHFCGLDCLERVAAQGTAGISSGLIHLNPSLCAGEDV